MTEDAAPSITPTFVVGVGVGNRNASAQPTFENTLDPISSTGVSNSSFQESNNIIVSSYPTTAADETTAPSITPTAAIVLSEKQVSTSEEPSVEPSTIPSIEITISPSGVEVSDDSEEPSIRPTISKMPSERPSLEPSTMPSIEITISPSGVDSEEPSEQPSVEPSTMPSIEITISPSSAVVSNDSSEPSIKPTVIARKVSAHPSAENTSSSPPPSTNSALLSNSPAVFLLSDDSPLSLIPTAALRENTLSPTVKFTYVPDPSFSPSNFASSLPSSSSSMYPSLFPTVLPSAAPSETPRTVNPSVHPSSSHPTSRPTFRPTFSPTHKTDANVILGTDRTFANNTNNTSSSGGQKITVVQNALANDSITFVPEWSGCVFPDGDSSYVVKGSDTGICINVSGGGDWSQGLGYSRWIFRPTADEYSHITMTNTYNDLVLNENSYQDQVSIHVASQKAVSFIRRFYDSEQNKIYPYLTAILDVDNGVVKGIAWDDSCVFCRSEPERCEENTYDFSGTSRIGPEKTKGCFFTKDECDKLHSEGKKDCDLNLYVVWTGTDKNGRLLSSSGSRWSAFPASNIPKISFPDLNKIKDNIADTLGIGS
eukprot:CAMPEP_0178958172 /NCGR_PEP_ID=MMETSP0789-20121207/11434_1 /TAXON_ID=3005 /ORGANISM="Rhizosolenia setigera, Strain CCMP 1694" /LENGTH=597 /DNA_ID=CAMNT_0020640727 /DNA_START=328 /DNA_END=2121 /DNA_ORIENTATION=+